MKKTTLSQVEKPEILGLITAAKRIPFRRKLKVRDFDQVLLRPIQPEDEGAMVRFHQALSEETIYSRYFEHMTLESRIRHGRLLRICTNCENSFALVAVNLPTTKHPEAILGIGRLSRTDDPLAADFALLIHDQAQGHGLGSALMKALMKLARACGFHRMIGEVLVANHEMLYVCRQFGFTLQTLTDEGLVAVTFDLSAIEKI